MKKLQFYKISPGGNTTILVTDPIVSNPADRALMANCLMDQLHLNAEQVGYISQLDSTPRLDMMGGEFCGNASRSLAALLAFSSSDKLIEDTEGSLSGAIEVSGVNRSLKVKVKKQGEFLDASVEMPINSSIEAIKEVSLHKGIIMHVVEMEGITHVLIDEDVFLFPEGDHVNVSEAIRISLGLTEESAVGCIWYKKSLGKYSIKPVVWVKGTNSTYFETACGSGTVALGLFLSKEGHSDVNIAISQPSGSSIWVSVDFNKEDNCFNEAWIGGNVSIIARGETFLYQHT